VSGFVATVPFPRWIWETGETIPDNDQMRDELTDKLRELWTIFRDKRLSVLGSRFDTRDSELALATYGNLEAERNDTFRTYSALVNDTGRPLQPFFKRKLTLKIYAGGKLARIENEYGDSPIYFMDPQANVISFITIMFARIPNRGWVAIR